MKKKPTKKLILNKKTVAELTADDMKHMKGASFLVACTDKSCSVVQACCDPWTTKPEAAQEDLG